MADELDTGATETGGTDDAGMDMEAAVESLGSDLFGAADDSAAQAADEGADSPAATDTPVAADPADKPAVVERPVPKSWAKEAHELWAKTPPEVQAQIELREKQMLDGIEQYRGEFGFAKSIRDVFAPYKAALQAQGWDEPKTVAYLMSTHQRLTQGTVEQRTEAYRALGKSLGLAADGAVETGAAADPHVKELTDKVNKLETSLTTREQADIKAARDRISKEVEAFASDPKHPYFDEVADDVIVYLNAGKSIEDAYEKAVFANPVTRAKEIARLQTEQTAKLRENARLDALKAQKAKGANVRSRDTGKAPTEPLGTMEDTMKSTLAEIRSRTH